MTNEEKIKAMSTEDLARFLNKTKCMCEDCPAVDFCNQYSALDCVGGMGCIARIKVWLMQEAEDGQH